MSIFIRFVEIFVLSKENLHAQRKRLKLQECLNYKGFDY